MIAELAAPAAADLIETLRGHYLPPGRFAGGIFATEIQSPDGSRRADALWCPWSSIDGAGLIGHEIKVTRTDLIVELADPMKADPWARFCREWWLVVAHPSLIDGLQLPAAWGVMAPPSGRRRRSMTILRPAPRLKPVDTGLAWQKIAAWSDFRATERVRVAENKAETMSWKAVSAERELLARQLAESGRVDARAAAIGRVLAAIDAAGRHVLVDMDTDGIAAAILDLEETRRLARRVRDEIRWHVDEARRLSKPFERIAADLEKVVGPANPNPADAG